MKIGSTDSSIEKLTDDLFDISQYVKGLSDFIKVCVTPMTISIQGDWGSGKTSIMNLVSNYLQNDVITVWFNTWQYSQFNMDDDLAISFLKNIIKSLDIEKANASKLNETLKKVGTAIKKTGLIMVDHYVAGMAAEELNKAVNKLTGGNDDLIDSIANLRKEFEDSISQKLEEDGKDRMVVFIDDLDRLNPKKAVELLEILKIFLDCEKCVFILAIDYTVVCQGVKEKYGNLIGEDKGKNFFDKIIQVPFKMPVAHYKIDRFVTEMLRQVGINLDSDESSVYVGLIQASVGCNPRTMKRLFNAYLLLTYISRNVELNALLDDSQEGMWYKKILFGLLCCQHAYEDLYNFLIINHEDFLGSDLLNAMCSIDAYHKRNMEDNGEDGEKEEYENLIETFNGKTDEYIQKISYFMKLLVNVIDRDGNHDLGDNELNGFIELLNLTTITSAGNDSIEAEDSIRKKYRMLTRQIMTLVAKDVSPVIKSMHPDNITKPVYQINQDSDTFKSTWAEVWAYISIDGHGQIWFENTLTVDVETGNLGLKIWTKRRKNFSKPDYTEYFSESPLVKDKGFIWNDSPYGIKKDIEDIGKISADEKEQKTIAQKVSEIIKEYLEIL